MYLRDACKIATEYGDPLLEDCPGNTEVPKCYDIASEALKNDEVMRRAADFKTKSYYSCNTIDEIKYALMNYGPLLASLKWYSDYQVKNGILVGGASKKYSYHAIVIYGFNEEGFLCQNSWGKLWGNGGRFIVPYSISFAEARGLIDLENDTYVSPPRPNKYLNMLYKAINFIVNLFRSKK
jgi:C1A family cysteine protease